MTLAINRRVRPAVMTWHEAARAAFKKDGHWLRRHIPPDFPRPHPSYGLFETEEVEKWINQRPYESRGWTNLQRAGTGLMGN